MALVEQLGDGKRYVQLAAIWHWCLQLCIYVTFFKFYIASAHSFFIFFFNLVSIDGVVDNTSMS